MVLNPVRVQCAPCGAIFDTLLSAGNSLSCPRCGRFLTLRAVQQAQKRQDWTPFWKGVAWVAGGTAIAIGVYKIAQALDDEDFGDGEYPRWFRDEMIQAHVDQHGCICLKCDRRVRRCDFHLDHIVPLREGGRTSRANAQVICGPCNLEKGAAYSLLGLIRGRR